MVIVNADDRLIAAAFSGGLTVQVDWLGLGLAANALISSRLLLLLLLL